MRNVQFSTARRQKSCRRVRIFGRIRPSVSPVTERFLRLGKPLCDSDICAVQKVLLLPLLPLLAGCAMMEPLGVRDRSQDYLYARTLPPLQPPEQLDAEEFYELYPIPELQNTGEERRQITFDAPEVLRRSSLDEVRIQKFGDRAWLIVNTPAAELWPQLRGFISFSRLIAARNDPRNGVLETRWLQRRESETRERYRFQVQPGLQENTAEVHILQDTEGQRIGWPEQNDNPGRALGMLEVFASYLVQQGDAPGLASLRASRISNRARMEHGTDRDGRPVLLLDIPFGRAWGAVEAALHKADFLVLDKDREAGIYYVAYDPERKVKSRLDQLGSASIAEAVAREELQTLEVRIDRHTEKITVSLAPKEAALSAESRETLIRVIGDHLS